MSVRKRSLRSSHSSPSILFNSEKIKEVAEEFKPIREKKKKPSAVIDEIILRDMGYKIGRVTSRLDFSVIKCAETDDALVDVKITAKSQVPSSILNQRILHELDVVRGLKHKNVLEYVCSLETNFKVYLISKSATNGTLDNYLNENCFAREPISLSFMTCLLNGVDYLHTDCGMAHRNLTPWNIFLDDSFLLRIGNFELATRAKVETTFCGSKHHAAPEVQRCEPYDPYAADIWSLGAIFYEILFGRVLVHDVKITYPYTTSYRKEEKLQLMKKNNEKARASSHWQVLESAVELAHHRLMLRIGNSVASGIVSMFVPPPRRPHIRLLLMREWVYDEDTDSLMRRKQRMSASRKSRRHSHIIRMKLKNLNLK